MIPEDQIRVIWSILISIPLSIILRYLPTPFNKYFSALCSIVLQVYVYHQEIYISLLFHVFIYLLIRFKGRKCGFLTTWISLLILSIYHIYRLVVDYGSWTLDVSTILMGNVCKYSLFAYSYQDGGQDQLKTSDQKIQKIVDIPSLQEFLCYCLFLPTCVVSTPITYHKYTLYINKSAHFNSIPFVDSLKMILRDFTVAVGCASIYFLGVVNFPVSYLSAPSFTDNSFLYILGYAQLSIYFYHWKYFFAFKLCMLPIHGSGVSYNPELDSPFSGVQTVNIWEFNTTLSLPNKINSWNIPVQEWLRKAVYERLSTSREKAKIITFLVSSFWHGFYGGYYFAFALFFMHMYVGTSIYKLGRSSEQHPLIVIYNRWLPFSRYLVLLLLTLSFSHSGIYFAVLSTQHCLDLLQALYYLPFVLLTTLIFVLSRQIQGAVKKNA